MYDDGGKVTEETVQVLFHWGKVRFTNEDLLWDLQTDSFENFDWIQCLGNPREPIEIALACHTLIHVVLAEILVRVCRNPKVLTAWDGGNCKI
jgi:hypothetical protein